MTGGRLQLEIKGDQNKYFNTNPKMIHFKMIYKRYSNYALETIKQETDDTIKLGNIVEYKIGRAGDLLSNLFLEIDLNLTLSDELYTSNDTIINFGYNIIDYVELSIGNIVIDKQSGEYMHINSNINGTNNINSNGYISSKSNGEEINKFSYLSSYYTNNQQMVGTGVHNIYNHNGCNYKNIGGGNTFYIDNYKSNILKGRLIIPFQFWFCKNFGTSLPLISLKYHEVIVKIKFNTITKSRNLIITTDNTDSETSENIKVDNESYTTPNIKKVSNESHYINNLGFNTYNDITITNDNSTYKLWGDYIFIDENERRQLINLDQEYLIEQVQYNTYNIENDTVFVNNKRIDLDFNFCVKELYWTFQREDYLYETDYLNLTNYDGNIEIIMNNKERNEKQNILYFTKYNLENYHNGVLVDNSIFIYSFSINPNEYQPKGFCNMSGLNNISLLINNLKLYNPSGITFNYTNTSDNSISTFTLSNQLQSEKVKINIYAINYNILKILDGKGSIVYVN